MHDVAKRSLAFTVATGGLVLTGAGYASAGTPAGIDSLLSPGRAQGIAEANQASLSGIGAPIGVRVPGAAKAKKYSPRHRQHAAAHAPQAGGSAAGASAAGASADGTVSGSPGILSGNTVQIPIDLGLNLCGDQVDSVAVRDTVSGSTCGGGSAAGGPDSGASASSATTYSGGILSGNTVQAPVDIPLNVCGDQVVADGAGNSDERGACGGAGSGGSAGVRGARATAVSDHSGGILSGNIVQVPVDVPVNACGDQVDVVGDGNSDGGSACATGSGAAGASSGSNATAVSLYSGGIGSGSVVQLPINVPVNACGDQVGVFAVEDFVRGSDCTSGGGDASSTSAVVGSGGVLSGDQAGVPIDVPVDLCGVQAIVVGAGNDTGPAACGSPGQPPGPGGSPSPSTSDSASPSGSASPSVPPPPGPGGSPSPSTSDSASPSGSASPSIPPPPGPGGSPSPGMSGTASPSGSPGASVPPPPGASGSPSPGSGVPSSGSSPVTTPGHHVPPHAGGGLAGTGDDAGLILAAAGAALFAGVGLRVAARRRPR
jgi:hypothetical protein